MKISTAVMASAATFATAAAIGIAGAPTSSADEAINPNHQTLGSQATLVNGNVVQGWTVSDLKPSTDAIPYQVHGTLWEATATDEAIQGSVIPIVSDLNARAASGQTYPALFQVATPQGVNPATLVQGQKTSGKVYFDVTGNNPDGVVYLAGGQNLACWVQSGPSAGQTGSQASPAAAGSATTPATAGTPAAPATAGTPAAPATAGSQGTPIPADSAATPATAGSPAVPASEGAQGAPAGSPTAPAPAGSQGTPIDDGAEAPAAGTPEAPAAGTPEAPAAGTPEAPAAGTPAAPAAGTPAAPAS